MIMNDLQPFFCIYLGILSIHFFYTKFLCGVKMSKLSKLDYGGKARSQCIYQY
jgi:hypothetical protein